MQHFNSARASGNTFFLEHALLPGGWASDVRVVVGADGLITAVEHCDSETAAVAFRGVGLPGMPNCHSHAFQRVMAGLAERATDDRDNFWSWRTAMYGLAAQITAEDLHSIAAQLYIEMVKAGYTSVAEFHYLHDSPQLDRMLRMSEAVLAASELAGIRLTHLPVLYLASGFSGKPPEAHQGRFVVSVEQYIELLARLRGRLSRSRLQSVGIAFHSLRAVTPEAIDLVLPETQRGSLDCVVHMHLAEQRAEVEPCLAWSGQRPAQWLLEHAPVDRRWCLVHATHMTDEEISGVARSGAVAGLCPTTEANLGDGLFPLRPYFDAGGAVAIGSDSNVSVSPIEELRWLEYGQ